MLTFSEGKTGTAPGAMTLTIPQEAGFGRPVPTDFDVSRAHLNYQRFHKGWVPGDLAGAEDVPATYEEALAELKVYRAKLEAEQRVAALQSTRSERTWTIVGGLVGVAGLLISIIYLAKGK